MSHLVDAMDSRGCDVRGAGEVGGGGEDEWRGIDDGRVCDEGDGGVVGEEKDDDERELERLVFGRRLAFGDEALWHRSAAATRRPVLDGGLLDEEDVDLEALPDDRLFFLDSGPAPRPGNESALKPLDASGDDEIARSGAPAWHDSDDERIVVSLAAVPRLRKLRVTEDEDLVGGREYIKRLRRQFVRLNGTPAWANWDWQKAAKRKRSSEDGDSSDGDESVDMDADDDGDDDSVRPQPLAQMLQQFKDALYAVTPAHTTAHKRRKLRPDTLDIQRMKDIPGAQPSAVTSLSLHPTLPILLSSGPASTLYLHHLDSSDPNNPNPLLTSLHIKRNPLTTTVFHPTPPPAPTRIFLSAPRPYFHVWNLPTGTLAKVSRIHGHSPDQADMSRFKLSPDGAYMALAGRPARGAATLNILDARSLHWLAQSRIESRAAIADFAWWPDSAGLTVAAAGGEVTEWSVREQRALARWADHGAVATTRICVGGRADGVLGGHRWVAVGSASGIVNVYDRAAWRADTALRPDVNAGLPPRPAPTRALTQLVTEVSELQVSLDGQLLLVVSRAKRDALRIVHLPSCAVYANWPTGNTPLGRVSAAAWARPDVAGEGAEGEGVVAVLVVGNEAGKIKMWEVRG